MMNAISKDKSLYVIMTLYAAAAWLLALHYGAAARFSLFIYSGSVASVTVMIGTLFMGWLCFYTMIKIRPPHLTAYLANDLKTRWLTKPRLQQALPFICIFMVFISVFSSVKSLIPVIRPYDLDPFFYELDRLLHFGTDPWRLLQPVLGYPFITFIMNVIYNLWFPVMFAVLYWQAFTLKQPVLRRRFFLSFLLCWIVNGSVLAVMLSSAGPAFYGRLLPDGPDPYAPLLSYLQSVNEVFPVWALTTQDMLWRIYEQNGLGVGSGISAMPSLHVSIAWLLVLFGFRLNKYWGYVFTVFFAFIMTGAVHLGWHYAVDGYLAVLITGLIWFMAGKYYAEND